jgi:hypothetical protein
MRFDSALDGRLVGNVRSLRLGCSRASGRFSLIESWTGSFWYGFVVCGSLKVNQIVSVSTVWSSTINPRGGIRRSLLEQILRSSTDAIVSLCRRLIAKGAGIAACSIKVV